MRKIKFSIFFTMLAALLFTACNEEVVRDPSPAATEGSVQAYFDSSNKSSITLGIDDSSFEVVISRENTDKAITIQLVTESPTPEKFSVPESVSFEAGEGDLAIVVGVLDFELLTTYQLSIEIPTEHTNPYADHNGYQKVSVLVMKDDFAPYAEGSYFSDFFENTWDAELEFSPATEQYRFKNCWFDDYHVYFKWDGPESSKVNMIGTANSSGSAIYVPTGYDHPTYGMVYAWYAQADINYYDVENQKFTFPINWNVILDGAWAGFGRYNDEFTITSFVE